MKEEIIDVEIRPKAMVLSKIGASPLDFAAALEEALERLANKANPPLPRAVEIPVFLAGQEQRLGDLATIRVRLGRLSPAPWSESVEFEGIEASILEEKLQAHRPIA
jgi:hypothetical protein